MNINLQADQGELFPAEPEKQLELPLELPL